MKTWIVPIIPNLSALQQSVYIAIPYRTSSPPRPCRPHKLLLPSPHIPACAIVRISCDGPRHVFRNELEQCEKLCETALRVSDGKREEASMVLAEVKKCVVSFSRRLTRYMHSQYICIEQSKRRRRWEQLQARKAKIGQLGVCLKLFLLRYRAYIVTLLLIVAKSHTCHSCTVVRIDGTLYARQVMFLRTEHAKAIQCYRDVLKHKPSNYKALQKLIDLLRRGGTLEEVTKPDAIHLLVLRSASTSHLGGTWCFPTCTTQTCMVWLIFPSVRGFVTELR